MTKIDDQMLMAYADGELNGLEQRRVEKALAADTDLEAQLANHTALKAEILLAIKDTGAMALVSQLASCGFGKVSYSVLGTPKAPKIPPIRIFTTFGATFTTAYDDLHYHIWDISFLHALHGGGSVFYSDLHNQLTETKEGRNVKEINLKIMQLYNRFGYHDLFLVPVKEARGICLFTIGLDSHKAAQTLERIM